MNKLLIILFITLLGSSCVLQKPTNYDNIYNTKWSIITINGISIDEMQNYKQAELNFSKTDSSYYGNNGCNRIKGKFIVEENEVSFSQGISTKRYCEAVDEQKFYSILSSTNSIKLKKKILLLYKGDLVLAEFQKSHIQD
mgnify:CR=1 FL=1